MRAGSSRSSSGGGLGGRGLAGLDVEREVVEIVGRQSLQIPQHPRRCDVFPERKLGVGVELTHRSDDLEDAAALAKVDHRLVGVEVVGVAVVHKRDIGQVPEDGSMRSAK